MKGNGLDFAKWITPNPVFEMSWNPELNEPALMPYFTNQNSYCTIALRIK